MMLQLCFVVLFCSACGCWSSVTAHSGPHKWSSSSSFIPSADSSWMKFLNCTLPACADHREVGFFIVFLPQLCFCSSTSYSAKAIALFLLRVWQSIFKKQPPSTSREGSHPSFTWKFSEGLRCRFKTNDQWYHGLSGWQSEEKLFFSETSLTEDLFLNWKLPI